MEVVGFQPVGVLSGGRVWKETPPDGKGMGRGVTPHKIRGIKTKKMTFWEGNNLQKVAFLASWSQKLRGKHFLVVTKRRILLNLWENSTFVGKEKGNGKEEKDSGIAEVAEGHGADSTEGERRGGEEHTESRWDDLSRQWGWDTGGTGSVGEGERGCDGGVDREGDDEVGEPGECVDAGLREQSEEIEADGVCCVNGEGIEYG